MARKTIENYSIVQKGLHWTIAILIVWQFTSTFLIDMQAKGSSVQNALKASHGLSGVTILLLMLVRIGVRLKRGAPALPDIMSSNLRIVAKLTHALLYVLIIAQTITGIMAGGGGIKLAAAVHGTIAISLFSLIALHIGAALWHLSKGEAVGHRMFRSR